MFAQSFKYVMMITLKDRMLDKPKHRRKALKGRMRLEKMHKKIKSCLTTLIELLEETFKEDWEAKMEIQMIKRVSMTPRYNRSMTKRI
jgi:mannose/fructose/N-acetylgalactosamine-specific phosphotransferase system component IID